MVLQRSCSMLLAGLSAWTRIRFDDRGLISTCWGESSDCKDDIRWEFGFASKKKNAVVQRTFPCLPVWGHPFLHSSSSGHAPAASQHTLGIVCFVVLDPCVPTGLSTGPQSPHHLSKSIARRQVYTSLTHKPLVDDGHLQDA